MNTEMTIDEIEKEMKECIKKFEPSEGYIFISYAHRDKERVYPKVLEWMREEYNIYIDMDFENHGSDDNWVEIMKTQIRSSDCVLAVCFASVNYIFSYASFIELLTMKSEETKGIRSSDVPIDIIRLDNDWDTVGVKDNVKKNQEIYQSAFKKMKAKMGDSFLHSNTEERKLFEEGIKSWKKNKKDTADTIRFFDENYKFPTETNFYVNLGTNVNNWIRDLNLNGNIFALESDRKQRFIDLEVYKREEENASKPTVNESPKTAPTIIPEPTVDEIPKIVDPIIQEPIEVEKTDTGNLLYFLGATAEEVSDKEIVLKCGSLVNKKTADSCPDKARRLREQAIRERKLVESGSDYRLTEDMTFKSLSGAATFVGGYSVSGATAWKRQEDSQYRRGRSSKTSDLISNNILSAGAILYVKDHPQQEAQLLENGDVSYSGRNISLNQFVQVILGPGSRNAYLYVFEKKTGRLLKELLDETLER
jgi:hypothetical protein